MKVTVQVVTQTDDGQEAIREVACVERDDLTPATLGLSLAEGKTVLQALQEGLDPTLVSPAAISIT